MASDLTNGCTEVIEILDEKEEGEISLEDVSSSEEGQLNERCNSRRRTVGQCSGCLSTKHCTLWCTTLSRTSLPSKNSIKKDAVQEKENYHHTKDSGYSGSKHPVSTLQENNSDLIPISSDSDMEIVGLADNAKQVQVTPQTKTAKNRKRKRKRRPQNNFATVENTAVVPPLNSMAPACSTVQKRDSQVLKDNHLPRVYHRESNSPHKRSGSPFSRSRIVKSPLRKHWSPIGRAISPSTKSRSPPGRPRSPVLQKSPVRRPRSPVRQLSPHSPTRSLTKKSLRSSVSPSNTYIDMYGNVTKLLKKVRHLKNVGSQSASRKTGKHKGHSPSLKDKLNNMMKGENESNESSKRDNEKKPIEEIDDEEDLALLRKMALETKPKRRKKNPEDTESKKVTQYENNNIIDDDVEDLELRMIALRSAMLKKHQNRQQRGVVAGKMRKPLFSARTNTESPFSQSFLDSIPIPIEENNKKFETLSSTPSHVLNENTNPEDMDLDSEVELEKEKDAEPYSPTDEISRQIIIDSELLGIQSSDVSFITPSSQNIVPPNTPGLQHLQSNKIEVLQTGASYLPVDKTSADNFLSPDIAYYSTTNLLPNTQSPTSSVNSVINPTEILEPSQCTNSEDNLPAVPYSPSQPIETPDVYFPSQDDLYSNSDFSQTPETPYSPTDTPMYDVELNNVRSLFNVPSFLRSDIISKPIDVLPSEKIDKKRCKSKLQSTLVKINLIPKLLEDINKTSGTNIPGNPETITPFYSDGRVELEKDNTSETSSMKADVGSAFDSPANSPDSTMIVVDELPETDLDGSPLVPMLKDLCDIEIHIPASVSQEIIKIAQEPLYLQGVPDVTKDANKIPTLVNRSLVPASILKTNKNLQQPLPQKKIEPHLEPAFKSAEMQPVQISTEMTKSNRLFKPIKLAPAIKKPQLRIVTPAAFNCSSNDNSFLEQEEPGNSKSAYATCLNETRNLLQGLPNEYQDQAYGKTWEKADTTFQSGNSLGIGQPSKTLSTLEQRTIIIEDQGKMIENDSDKEKKKPSRRNKSAKNRARHTNKIAKDDKHMETQDKTDDITEVTTDRVAGEKISSSYRQTQNLNKTDKNHELGDSISKKKNSRDKLKKPMVERSKKDRDKRAKSQYVLENEIQSKSGHKHDKLLNNNKNTNANIEEEQRVKVDNQSRKTIEIQENNALSSAEHQESFKSQDRSIDVQQTDRNSTMQWFNAVSNIQKKTPTDEKLDNNTTTCLGKAKSSDSNETNVNILNSSLPCNVESKSVGNAAASASENRTQDSEDSMSDNTACKKVEANKRRRSSLDEDEETLRAILLASLAKRSKPAESFSTTTETNALANLSHSSVNTSTDSVKGLPSTAGTKVSFSSIYDSNSDNTPPLLGQSNLNSNNYLNNKSTLEILPQVKMVNTASANETSSENTSHVQTMLSTAPLRKRSTSTNTKAPLKRIVKKPPISASTRVVNNAKKYQNTLVQKKLNLQKTTTVSNAQKTLNHTNLHGNQIIDGSRSKSMITQPLSDTQRFVINLASDSESDDETESPYENSNKPAYNIGPEQKPNLNIPMSDFERSVDLLLKEVRKKQETAAAVKPSSTKITATQKPASPVLSVSRKSATLSSTPLAVRHLPVPLQEEYRRLKQQILEREKLKLQKTLINNNSPLSPSSKSSGTPPGPLSPASSTLSPTASKQSNNTPSHSQSRITASSRINGTRSVSIQSHVKNTVSSITTRVNPISEASGSITSVKNFSIQIPNELMKIDLTPIKSSNNLYIPVSNSQTRVVTAVKIPQEVANTKDAKEQAVTVKDQFKLKTVQVQLQQGKTGRTVSLNETVNLGKETAVIKSQEVEQVEAQESAVAVIENPAKVDSVDCTDKNLPTDLASSSHSASSDRTVDDAIDVRENYDYSVDSAASTLIISREGDKTVNSYVADSLASTVVISRSEEINDSSRLELLNSENSEEYSSVVKQAPDGRPARLKNNKGTWEKIRDDVGKELDVISALPPAEQKTYLTTIEQNLVKKRYAILDDLSEISGNLGQLEMEREVQSNMALEVRKLQEQLKLAEERLQAQRNRVNQMAPNITATYEKFNNGRRECVKMTKICLGLGCLVVGANYKIPAAGAQLLNKRMKQVAGCTQQLSKKKKSVIDSENKCAKSSERSSQTNSSENYLNTLESVSMPSTILENSTNDCDESLTTGSVTETENRKNAETESIARLEMDQTDTIVDEDTLTLEENRTKIKPFAETIRSVSPQLTSTPNYPKKNSSVPEVVQDSKVVTSTFVLDSPRAGLSGQNVSLEECRFLRPYTSVLTHLNVSRTTDPNGILCPYELMGTCRDEDCKFVHQLARNS